MTAKKIINLALQGGGAHGAYTWGVLDRLIEEDRLAIEGISGTSAGAINGALFASGMTRGGADAAKADLEEFWRRVSQVAAWSPIQKNSLSEMLTGWDMNYTPGYHWFDVVSRVISPYVFNPLNIHPMRAIIDELIDFKRLHRLTAIKLFVTATHIASGQPHVFQCKDISTDALLASACIPFLFQAVEVEGEHYWDGGYMGNPAIWPLIYHCRSKDVALVQINPIHNKHLPTSAGEIIDRLNEITFNSSLIAEMRAIDFVSRLIKTGKLSKSRYKDMRMHLIYSPDNMHGLTASSKMNADWDFFLLLKEAGRATADEWLRRNWKHLGSRGTVDIREKFLLGPSKPRRAGAKKPRRRA